MVQPRAESFNGDRERRTARGGDLSGLRGPRQDVEGSHRPGGGLLLHCVHTLRTASVQRQQQLVSDCE